MRTRFALLRSLKEAGLNDFDAYRADGHPRPSRFPVFVRDETGHNPALTGLIETQVALDEALVALVEAGHPLRGLIVIEFCAAPVATGVYRRWGGFLIGGRVHLDHAVQEDHWNVKWGTPGLTTDAQFDELDAAIRSNSFADAIRSAFGVACIEYGRADFGIVDGRLQIWEINTNPFIAAPGPHRSPVWEATLRFAAERLASCLDEVDVAGDDDDVVVDPACFPAFAQRLLAEMHGAGSPSGSSTEFQEVDGAPDSSTGAEVAALRADSARLRTEIEAIRQSTSWRVTAPMRAVMERFRGTVGQARRETPPSVVPRSTAICMLRNCIDIVPFLCGHYLHMGIERVEFIDDSSSDGTPDFVTRLSRREPRIRVRHIGAEGCDQAVAVTTSANEAIAEGFRIVLPFDADEFWAIDRVGLAAIACDASSRVVAGHWVNFVQRRQAARSHPGGLLRMRYRTSPSTVTAEEVVGYHEPFTCYAGSKVAVVTDEPIDFFKGQHALNAGPDRVDPRALEVFHAPLRNRAELYKRALDYEPRRARFRQDATESWQSAFHASACEAGRIDEVWAANSVDRYGFIDVYGTRRPAIRDLRLSRLLSQAALYMLRHHGILAL